VIARKSMGTGAISCATASEKVETTKKESDDDEREAIKRIEGSILYRITIILHRILLTRMSAHSQL
jgi:hypothetical protein